MFAVGGKSGLGALAVAMTGIDPELLFAASDGGGAVDIHVEGHIVATPTQLPSASWTVMSSRV